MMTKLNMISKINRMFILILSISFSFTIFFFSPVELMIRNQMEFLIGTEYILVPMLILSALISIVSIVLLHILLMIHEMLYIVISRIMTGLLFSFYIQEMFLNGKMPAIIGDGIQADFSTLESSLNFLLAYLLLMLPLILYFMKKQYPNIQFLQIGNAYTLPYLMGLIFVMQIFGLIGSIAQFGLNRYEKVFNTYLSYEPSMSLSRKNNIVVFLMDMMDSYYMDELLETYPDLYQELDGFTFYQNNLSCYLSTFPSVTHMLTGRTYEGEDRSTYFNQAWSEPFFLDELKQNDYQVSLFLDRMSTYNKYSDLYSRCDNLKSLCEEDCRFNYLGKKGIVPTMIRLSFGKLMPYALKSIFINEITSDFSTNFFGVKYDMPDLMSGAVGTSADLKYYAYLTSAGLTDDHPQNTFTFIHLNGAHDASEDVSRLYSDEYLPGSFGNLSTTRGEFVIISEYIRQLKALGIYDQSTIIILGDHGRISIAVADDAGDFTAPIVTALLIKPAQAESAELKIDSSAELSNAYLGASVLDYAGIDHDAYGYSYSDVIEQHIHTERIVQNVMGKELTYSITGDAREFSNWEQIN